MKELSRLHISHIWSRFNKASNAKEYIFSIAEIHHSKGNGWNGHKHMYHFPKQIFLDKSMSHFLRQSLLSRYKNIDYGRKCSFLHNKSKLFLHFPPATKYSHLYLFYGKNSPCLAFAPTHNCFLISLCIFLSCYLHSMLTLSKFPCLLSLTCSLSGFLKLMWTHYHITLLNYWTDKCIPLMNYLHWQSSSIHGHL